MKEEEERREVEDKKDIREKEREEEQEEKEEAGEGESWLELSMAEMELLQRMEEANRSNSILMLIFTSMFFTTRLIECDSKSLASLPSTNCNSTNSTGSSVHSRSSSECRSEVG